MEEKIKIGLKGLDCANCAAKIENDVSKLQGIKNAHVNLMKQEMTLETEMSEKKEWKDKVVKIVNKYEPDVLISFPEKKGYTEHQQEHCHCHGQQEHCHEESNSVFLSEKTGNLVRWRVKGLTCANCSAKIEAEVQRLEPVASVQINLMKQELSISLKQESQKKDLEKEIKKIVKKHEPDVEVLAIGEKKQEEPEWKEEMKKKLLLFGTGIILFFIAELVPMPKEVQTVVFLVSYLIFGLEVLITAAKNIGRGQIFDENFLMSISTLGAIAIGEMAEAVFVMLFYQIGETFQDFAVNRSRKSIQKLMDIRPDYANLERDGKVIRVSPEQVKVGDIIIVKPGEKIPLDGIVLEGEAMLDTSALTGESVPRKATVQSEVLSASINTNGYLKVTVTKGFEESTASKIIELVENAGSKKSKTEQFITKFARVYTPMVVAAAAVLAILPPLFGVGSFGMWFGRALIFLVISCPCALVLSVPLGFFSGIGEASAKGILVKGSNFIQVLNEVDTIVFDKTGTLTEGVFEVTKIECKKGFEEGNFLKWTAMAEKMSNHPIAKSILHYYEKKNGTIDEAEIQDYEEISGHGVHLTTKGHEIYAGNKKLMEKIGIKVQAYDGIGSIIYTAIDGNYAGYLVVSDKVKKDSREAIQRLKKIGIKSTIMLTGDRKAAAKGIQEELGIDQCYSELLPQEKVEKLEELLKKKEGGKVAFVGDGINDAPVLARADIGIAMGGIGSDAAIEAADVVIMNDELSRIADGILIARSTNKIVIQNIIFALGVKFIVLVLGAVGIASMWMAVFADVGVALLAILNSMRKKGA